MIQCRRAMQQQIGASNSNDGCPLSIPAYSVSIYSSIFDVGTAWEQCQPPHGTFLQRPYLAAIEKAPPGGMKFRYIVFQKDGEPLGVALCQLKRFSLENSIKGEAKRSRFLLFRWLGDFFRGLIRRYANYDLMTCGNLMLTGEHGFYFDPEKISTEESMLVLEEGLKLAIQHFKQNNINVDGVFVKDIFEDSPENLKNLKFHEFLFHPNMILHFRPEWSCFEDYLAAMSSKYRVRAKRAFKAGKDIERRELTEDQIRNVKSYLYELYQNISLTAGVNMADLHEDYFLQLKIDLGEKFKLYGYYLEGELIGFHTTIDNGEELEANFLGFVKEYNRSHKVYLNMLYDMARYGVENGYKKLVFARTAMEIKSSVGAVPHNMYCFIRANNSVTNTIVQPALNYFRPKDDWIPRSPFK